MTEQIDLDYLTNRFSRMLEIYGEATVTTMVVEALATAIDKQPPRPTVTPRERLDKVMGRGGNDEALQKIRQLRERNRVAI